MKTKHFTDVTGVTEWLTFCQPVQHSNVFGSSSCNPQIGTFPLKKALATHSESGTLSVSCAELTQLGNIPQFLNTKPQKKNSTSRPPYINGILSFHRRFSVISIGPQERSNSSETPSAQVGGSVGFLGKPQRRIGTAKAYTGRPEDVSW